MIKEVLTSVRKTCVWALAPIGMLVAFSCQDDLVAERQPVATGDEIAFSVASDSAIAARSVASAPSVTHRQFLTTIGKDSLFLYTTIEENTDQPFGKSSESRAASNTTASLSTFYVDALYNGEEQFMNATKVSRDDENSPWTYSPLKYWPNNEGDFVDFYGYTAVPNTFAWGATKHKSFTYTLPSAAKDQPDLIFAQALGQKKQNVNGSVNLHFYHALSAVLFKIGTLPEDISLDNLTVTLNKVKSKGTCDITNTNGELSFDWDKGMDHTAYYSETFTKDGVFANNEELSTDEGEEANAFMMIPHTFGEEASMNISFRIGEVNYNFNHPLVIEGKDKDGNPKTYNSWDPNTKYTYILTIKEYVEVEIEEDFKEGSNVKKDVRFQNTGLSNAYMRAAIVGYWVVDEEDDIVLPWSIYNEEQGERNLGASWTYNEDDDFYYYNSVVKPGEYTENLINSYVLKQNPPVAGAELVLNVVVQSVAEDVFKGENAPWKLKK